MIRKLLLLGCVTATLSVGALATATSASANWTTNGDATGTAFSDTAGPSLMTVVTTGTAPQGVAVKKRSRWRRLLRGAATGIKIIAGIITVLEEAKVIGQTAAAQCDTTNEAFNGLAYSPAADLTSGQNSGITCVVTKAACGNSTTITGGITITGSVNETYGNTSQQFAMPTTGQNLVASWPGAGCLAGTSPGSVTWTNSSGTALTSAVTSAFKPQITN
jgi:hypothetical protein